MVSLACCAAIDVERYAELLKRLLDYGKKVAVCEQFLDPNEKNKLAKREVTQVYTPATVVDDEYLDSLSSSFVSAINLN